MLISLIIVFYWGQIGLRIRFTSVLIIQQGVWEIKRPFLCGKGCHVSWLPLMEFSNYAILQDCGDVLSPTILFHFFTWVLNLGIRLMIVMTNDFTVLWRGYPPYSFSLVDFIRLWLEDFERAKFNLGRQGEANIISEGSANLPKASSWLPCFGVAL